MNGDYHAGRAGRARPPQRSRRASGPTEGTADLGSERSLWRFSTGWMQQRGTDGMVQDSTEGWGPGVKPWLIQDERHGLDGGALGHLSCTPEAEGGLVVGETGLPTLTGSRTAPSVSVLYAEFLIIIIRCNGKKVVQLKRKCESHGCKRCRDTTRRECRVKGRQQHPDHKVADWRWAAKREPRPGPSPPRLQHSATQCAPAQDGSGQALHPYPCLYKRKSPLLRP